MIYPAKAENIDKAIELLLKGEIIVYPTDTLYGFGVDATNTNAIKKLNNLKKRAQPLSVILDNIKNIPKYAYISSKGILELNNFFPGPYTILLIKKESNLSSLVFAGSNKIGIRIPNHPFPIKIVEQFKRPIITTSINKHNQKSLNNIQQIKRNFPGINIFKDAFVKPSKGSTIIDMALSPYKIIRKGDGDYSL